MKGPIRDVDAGPVPVLAAQESVPLVCRVFRYVMEELTGCGQAEGAAGSIVRVVGLTGLL